MAASMYLYLGTRKGAVALQSTDGETWEPLSEGLGGWEVPKLTVNQAQPQRVVAGTRGDGVWISEDAGQTWNKPSYGRRGPGKVRCVMIDDKDPDTIYAGTEPIDIFVTHDGAKSWERLESVWDLPSIASVTYPVPTVEPHVREIVQDPKTPTTLYSALQVGYILKSLDSGKTWHLLDKGLDLDVHTIVIDHKDPDRLFIATGGEGARQGLVDGRAFYRSADGGESWGPMALEFPHFYSIPLAMHPKNPNILYGAMATGDPRDWSRPTGAESVVIRSEDGGATWQEVGGGLAETSKVCPSGIIFDEENPDHMYVGLQNGEVYSSRDGGDSWGKLNVKVSSIANMKLVHAS